jgi:molecular chaperone GrpE
MSKSRDARSQDDADAADVSTSGESEKSEQIDDSDSLNTESLEIEIETGDDEGADDLTGEVLLEAQIVELNEQLLRKQAEFENFRKRMFREREEAAKSSNAKLLLDLVEVIDNFERAIKSAGESQDLASFHEGIELIEKQFISMLESKWGLHRFESEGEEFDPEKHEAIAVDQSGENPPQTVVEDYQKGYLLHDRVIRHAKVRVAMPNTDTTPSDETGGTDEETE